MKNSVQCQYFKGCYLAEGLMCYGFKSDCPLYLRSNGEPCSEARFHAAVDKLISKTKEKHERLTSDADAEEKSSPAISIDKPSA